MRDYVYGSNTSCYSLPYCLHDTVRAAPSAPAAALGPSDSAGGPQSPPLEPAYSSASEALSGQDQRPPTDDVLHPDSPASEEDIADPDRPDSHMGHDPSIAAAVEHSAEADKEAAHASAAVRRGGRDGVQVMVAPNLREALLASIVLAQRAVRGRGFIV